MINEFKKIEIEISTTCNRACSYCPNSLFDRGREVNKKFMNKELFEKIVKDLKAINYTGELRFHFYNEPLLDSRLSELVRYSKEMLPGVFVNIFTNGDFLDYEKYIDLVEAGVDKLNITAHSRESSYLKKIYSIINKNYVKKNMIEIEFKSLLILNNRSGYVSLKNPYKGKFCHLSLENLTIGYRGDVLLCCNDYFSKYKFGNIRDCSIDEIWHNTKFQKLRNNISRGIYELTACQKCQKGYQFSK